MLYRYINFNKKPIVLSVDWHGYDGHLDSVAMTYANNPQFQVIVPFSASGILLGYRRGANNDVVLRVVTVDASGVNVLGAEIIIYNGTITAMDIAVDPASGNGVILLRTAPSHYPKSIVFKISNSNTLTIGLSVQLFAGAIHYPSVVMLDSLTVLFAFQSTKDNAGQMMRGMLDMSHLTISWDPKTTFEALSMPLYCQLTKLNSQQVILCYRSGLSGTYLKAQLIHINGATITLGNVVTVVNSAVGMLKSCLMAPGQLVVAYRHNAHVTGEVVLLTITNNMINIGGSAIFYTESVAALGEVVLTCPQASSVLIHYTVLNLAWRSALIDVSTSVPRLVGTVDHLTQPVNIDSMAALSVNARQVMVTVRNHGLGDTGQYIKLNV
ncbi:MAG: hypothetical protein IPP74_11130 [Alphaproteobacteria bacterium]|nr:hypothetical protein [Alphaproteobacteria bacterium]